ncbi:hypothetical protein EGI32_05265 [Ferruginibacter sp. HRS2-29]|nr:hypothetical protein [Ferruginibacter sp. HRS2-29]
MMFPEADFDASLTFYYDETNNIKKFHVREDGFNAAFTANFILGGLLYEDEAPDLQPLIDGLKLQKNSVEIKFKHIAKGEFLDCLKSQKLQLFLDFILKSKMYLHYSSLNLLYWSIVDIVDSAIAVSEEAKAAGPVFSNHLKNDLYKLCRLEIDSVIELFNLYNYPNIKKEKVTSFIEDLTSLFEGYIDTQEFHFGLESLRQILKQAKKKESLPFIMDETDRILIGDFSHFYLRPVYTFKNSQHVFDKEDDIIKMMGEYRILDENEEVKNYSFEDSKTCPLIQCSDVLMGLLGKFSAYTNTKSHEEIFEDLIELSDIQKTNLQLLINLIDKSHDRNIGFIHSTDCYEELSKIPVIRDFFSDENN